MPLNYKEGIFTGDEILSEQEFYKFFDNTIAPSLGFQQAQATRGNKEGIVTPEIKAAIRELDKMLGYLQRVQGEVKKDSNGEEIKYKLQSNHTARELLTLWNNFQEKYLKFNGEEVDTSIMVITNTSALENGTGNAVIRYDDKERLWVNDKAEILQTKVNTAMKSQDMKRIFDESKGKQARTQQSQDRYNNSVYFNEHLRQFMRDIQTWQFTRDEAIDALTVILANRKGFDNPAKQAPHIVDNYRLANAWRGNKNRTRRKLGKRILTTKTKPMYNISLMVYEKVSKETGRGTGEYSKGWQGRAVDAFINHMTAYHIQLLTNPEAEYKPSSADRAVEEERRSGNFVKLLLDSKNNTAWYTGGDAIGIYNDYKINIQVKSKLSKSLAKIEPINFTRFYSVLNSLKKNLEDLSNNLSLGNYNEFRRNLYNRLKTSGYVEQVNAVADKVVENAENQIKESFKSNT